MDSQLAIRDFNLFAVSIAAAVRRLTAQHAGVCGILLGGSVARGDARPGSDIDMLVIDATSLSPGYIRFYEDGRAIDVRTASAGEVEHLADQSDECVGRWFVGTWIGDQFLSHRPLYWGLSRQTWVALKNLLVRRSSSAVAQSMGLSLLETVESDGLRARQELHRGLLLESRQTLRRSLQWVLAHSLISTGHLLKSAKRRVEQVDSLGSHDQSRMTRLVDDIVGLDTVHGAQGALDLSRKRQRWRTRFLEDLARLAPALNDPWTERNVHATDEYYQVIREGAWRGAVNHLRCISGLQQDAGRLSSARGAAANESLSAFIADPGIDVALREDWLELLGGEPTLSTLSEQIDSLQEFVAITWGLHFGKGLTS